MKINSSIKQNFLYNSAYQLLAMIVPLVTTPYLSRILGSEGIGRYSYAYSIAYYFVVFAMLGVNNYGNRTISEFSDDIEKRSKSFWSIYAFQVVTAILAILGYVVFVFALAGAFKARGSKLDIFGGFVVAFVSAYGIKTHGY